MIEVGNIVRVTALCEEKHDGVFYRIGSGGEVIEIGKNGNVLISFTFGEYLRNGMYGGDCWWVCDNMVEVIE